MTGGRALSCVLCRILRVIEINRRISYVTGLRLPAGAACINTKRTFNTSSWLHDRNKDTEQGSSSSSSSDEEYSSNSSGSDSDSETKDVKSSKEKGMEDIDMMSLLGKMRASEEKWGSQHSIDTNLKKIEPSIDKKLVTEAIELSKVLPGEKEKSETDLLSRLLTQFETTEKQKKGAKPAEKIQEAPDSQEVQEISFDIQPETENLSKVISKVSKKSETKEVSNLLAQFGSKGKQKEGEAVGEKMQKEPDLSSVLGQMTATTKSDSIDDDFDDKRRIRFRKPSKLLQGKPLGIFTAEDMKTTQSDKKSLFDVVEEEERDELLSYPPSNAFEEQIQWTREGKLWTFPIDNEAGWEEESNVEFYEHVFLDDQLLDFPKKGPIRHFMELVTVALSKNPYLTVAQKHEHIDWYRNYFRNKYDILEPRLGRDGVIQSQA